MATPIKPLSENEKIKIDFYIKEIDKVMPATDFQWNMFQSFKKQWTEKKRLTINQREALYIMYERSTCMRNRV